MITFLSALILNIDYGLFIGIGISIFMVVIKDQLLPVRTLVQYKNSSNYVDIDSIKNDNETQVIHLPKIINFNFIFFKHNKV